MAPVEPNLVVVGARGELRDLLAHALAGPALVTFVDAPLPRGPDSRVDVVLVPVERVTALGIGFLLLVRESFAGAPLLLIATAGNVDLARELASGGADEVVLMPPEPRQLAREILRRVERRRFGSSGKRLRPESGTVRTDADCANVDMSQSRRVK
jgi:DNA-binding NtrC family response regulator